MIAGDRRPLPRAWQTWRRTGLTCSTALRFLRHAYWAHEWRRPSVAIRRPGGPGTTSRHDGSRSRVAVLPAGRFGRRHVGRHGKSDPEAGVVLRSALSDRRHVVRARSMKGVRRRTAFLYTRMSW